MEEIEETKRNMKNERDSQRKKGEGMTEEREEIEEKGKR